MQNFRPRTFASLAERLCSHSDEASHRSAISRAYYASFLVTRDLLRIQDMSPDVHGLACRELTSVGLDQLALELEQLRKLRNRADYDTGRRFSRKDAVETVRIATALLDDLITPSSLRLIRRHLRKRQLKARAMPLSPARSRRGRPGTARR